MTRNDRSFDIQAIRGGAGPSVATAPARRAWAVTTVILGLVTFAVIALFYQLPQVEAGYPAGSGAAALRGFQFADSEAALRGVFGDPADPLIVAAMDATNRLDLYAFIPIYGVFLLMAGPLVTRRLDTPLTGVILGAVVVGLVGDVVETSTQLRMTADLGSAAELLGRLGVGAWMKYFGLAIAAVCCAVACVVDKPRRLGLAFGGVMQVLSTLAAWYDPSLFGSGLAGSVIGFWFGLTIQAIQNSLAGVRLWPRSRRVVVAAPGLARKAIGVVAIAIVGANAASAQELEARAYSAAPIGTKIIVGGVGGSKGGILFDPSLDVEDVQADLTIAITGVGYTFGLAGRQARVLAIFPVAWGSVAGHIGVTPQHQDLRGLVDPRVKLSVALRGAPAMTRSEFARARRRTVIGASVTVMPPLGDYHPSQLINLGYNRWAIKPELGATRSIGKWTFEGAAGLWLFTTNERYAPGFARKEQDPIGSFQGHVSYALPHRAWVAFDATWFAGGQTRVDGVESPDLQRNSRLGGTLSISTFANQSVKVTYSTGTTTRRGTDFDTLNVTWQVVVF